jgi:hypothetical protein
MLPAPLRVLKAQIARAASLTDRAEMLEFLAAQAEAVSRGDVEATVSPAPHRCCRQTQEAA